LLYHPCDTINVVGGLAI